MRDKLNLHTTERGSSENSPAPDESQTYHLFITKHVTYCNAITTATPPPKKKRTQHGCYWNRSQLWAQKKAHLNYKTLKPCPAGVRESFHRCSVPLKPDGLPLELLNRNGTRINPILIEVKSTGKKWKSSFHSNLEFSIFLQLRKSLTRSEKNLILFEKLRRQINLDHWFSGCRLIRQLIGTWTPAAPVSWIASVGDG